MLKRTLLLAAASAICAAQAAAAQETAPPSEQNPVEAEDAQSANPSFNSTGPNADEMADSLNAQQQIKQSYTLERTINGEVVDTEKRTITYSRDDPVRASEAGSTPLQELQEAFNREALTRSEAFEEAKLDFITADVDRNELMTDDEFSALVATWRNSEARRAEADSEETARQRQYRAFVAGLDPVSAELESQERAKAKFNFMSGAMAALNREDYIREYLLDFDSMDKDGDMILRGDELLQFRALNRGESIEM